MTDVAQLHQAMLRAALAPSVHNTQPARWRVGDDALWLACDLAAVLPAGDPLGRDAGLSRGAVAEAMVLTLADLDLRADVIDLWEKDDRATIPGHRIAARLTLREGAVPDPLAAMLERRFTWRGGFDPAPVPLGGWGRPDTVLITDPAGKN